MLSLNKHLRKTDHMMDTGGNAGNQKLLLYPQCLLSFLKISLFEAHLIFFLQKFFYLDSSTVVWPVSIPIL